MKNDVSLRNLKIHCDRVVILMFVADGSVQEPMGVCLQSEGRTVFAPAFDIGQPYECTANLTAHTLHAPYERVHTSFGAFSKRYFSASTLQNPPCLAHISASAANSGSVLPSFSKSVIAVRGIEMSL